MAPTTRDNFSNTTRRTLAERFGRRWLSRTSAGSCWRTAGSCTASGWRRVTGLGRGAALLLGAAALVGCTPPWYWFSTIEADGRFLADGHCALDVRGDVSRRTVLRVTVLYVGNGLGVTCGGAYPEVPGESRDMSSVMFILPMRAPDGHVAPGMYPVVPDRWAPGAGPEFGTAYSEVLLYPEPADAGRTQSYRVPAGRLTIGRVSVAPGGDMRVTGTFHIRGRRYIRFD